VGDAQIEEHPHNALASSEQQVCDLKPASGPSSCVMLQRKSARQLDGSVVCRAEMSYMDRITRFVL